MLYEPTSQTCLFDSTWRVDRSSGYGRRRLDSVRDDSLDLCAASVASAVCEAGIVAKGDLQDLKTELATKKDLRELKAQLAKVNEANKELQLMLAQLLEHKTNATM